MSNNIGHHLIRGKDYHHQTCTIIEYIIGFNIIMAIKVEIVESDILFVCLLYYNIFLLLFMLLWRITYVVGAFMFFLQHLFFFL